MRIGHGRILNFDEIENDIIYAVDAGSTVEDKMGSNGIFDSLRHGIDFALLGKGLAGHDGIHGSFHSREILVFILIQAICLGNGCVYCNTRKPTTLRSMQLSPRQML